MKLPNQEKENTVKEDDTLGITNKHPGLMLNDNAILINSLLSLDLDSQDGIGKLIVRQHSSLRDICACVKTVDHYGNHRYLEEKNAISSIFCPKDCSTVLRV